MRDELRKGVSARYSGAAHLAFTLTVSLGVTALLASRVRHLGLVELAAVPLFFLFCCLVEYVEHRYVLHRRQRFAPFAFRIHTLEHHRFFTVDAFEPEHDRDYAFILFPPGLVVGYMALVVAPFTALFHALVSPNVGFLVGATGAAFFFLYEVIHLASHLGERWPLRFGLLRWLGAHHRTHHETELMTTFNFNVVCPVFDWAFGTLARPR